MTKPRRHWLVIVLLGAAALVGGGALLGWLAAVGYEAYWASAEAEARASLSAAGLGLDPDDLLPAPASNGAEALGRAFAVLAAVDDDRRAILSDAHEILGGDIAMTIGYPDLDRPAQAARLRAVLAECEPALPHLDEALEAEAIAFELDWEQGLDGSLDHLMPLKDMANHQRARALVACEEGRHAQAWRELGRLLELCERLRDPILIGRLVRHAMVGIAVDGLERLLRQGPPPPPETRAELQELLTRLERVLPFSSVVRCELALALATLDQGTVQGVEAALGMGGGLANSGARFVPRFVLESWLAGERAALVAYVSQVIRAAQAPPPQIPARLAALPPPDRSDGILATLLAPAYDRAQGKDLTTLAKLRLARVLLDLAGQDPLPSALPQSLQDPWEPTRPLRYRRERADRAVVWSVGEDGVDDGGVRIGDGDVSTYDEVLVLERPAGE